MKVITIAKLASALALLCDTSGPVLAQASAQRTAKDSGQSQSVSEDFLELAKRHASLIFQNSPEWATQMGVTDVVGGNGFQKRLSSFSPESNEQLRNLNKQLLKEVKAIDRSRLSGTARATYDVMLSAYDLAAQQNKHQIGNPSLLAVNAPYAVDQLFGPQVNIPRFFTAQIPIHNEEQMESYIIRLSQVERVMNELVEMTEADAARGVVPPKFALDAIATSARGFITPEVEKHPIFTSFADKLGKLEGVSDVIKNNAKDRIRSLLRNSVNPAFNEFATRIEVLAQNSSEDAGIWKLPAGDELYQIALNSYGANGLTADEIHEIGLADVRRIHSQMDQILQNQGYSEGSIGDRMNALSKDPIVLWPNTDEAKAEILEMLEGQIQSIAKVAPRWFGRIPSQPVEVRRIPVYEEGSAGGAYYTPPSLDGSQPGVFWINLKDTADWPKYSLKSLVYHEAVPGHHFQASTQLEIKDMPLIRNMIWFADYGEGWALYVEALAVEMGMYEKDPLGDLGRLKMELYRAARLVVDTGIHHRRWTRQQAIDWMVETTGETVPSITREIDRYSVWPGQATSYKIGMIKFQRLREKAQRELGSKFDIRAFHDELLVGGAMPMAVLEARMGAWIETQKEL